MSINSQLFKARLILAELSWSSMIDICKVMQASWLSSLVFTYRPGSTDHDADDRHTHTLPFSLTLQSTYREEQHGDSSQPLPPDAGLARLAVASVRSVCCRIPTGHRRTITYVFKSLFALHAARVMTSRDHRWREPYTTSCLLWFLATRSTSRLYISSLSRPSQETVR